VESGRLNVGVIGAGLAFQHIHLPNIVRHADRLVVSGIVTRTAESAARAAARVFEATGERPPVRDSTAELLAGHPDVVLLGVPITSTYKLALQVLAAGCHLICEKPLAENAAEAAEIVEVAATARSFLGVAENFRYQSRFREAANLVGGGTIGNPRAFFLSNFHYIEPDELYSVTPWRQRGHHRGGYLLDAGSHVVAGMRAMLGETPTSVHALPASFHPGHLGAPWDTALANLTFESGIIGHLALGYGSPDREAGHWKVLGTTGTMMLMNDSLEIWRLDRSADVRIMLHDTSDGVAHEWDDFVQVLCADGTPAFSPWEAVADLAVLDAILESAEDGGVVSVQSYKPQVR
jgi:predicted dehydrogenase